MAYELLLPDPLRSQGWKVKIFDKERVEEPHVTVIRKTRHWRFGLRARRLMDDEPPPNEVPREVTAAILASLDTLVEEWDQMYPHSPVNSEG